MAPEKSGSKAQAWFCNTVFPASDVTVEVDNMTFHVHKLPLMSRSRKLLELISEQEEKNQTRTSTIQNAAPGPEQKIREQDEEDEDHDDDDKEDCHITLTNFPGGSEAFEAAAKFCYSVKIDLSTVNVAPLRCAAEYLQMTEDHSEDNLIARTEGFLSQFVFKNISSTIKTLSACQNLLPEAEDVVIVQRCINAIVSREPNSDPTIFGWPVNEITGVRNIQKPGNGGRKLPRGGGVDRSWLDEVGNLSYPFLKRLISAMKDANWNAEIVDVCLINYAKKYIPGISRSARKLSSSSSLWSGSSEWSQRELLETIASNLMKEKTSNTTTYLFGLLRNAYILNASEACRLTLEKKIGSQLEHATLDDLLIPSYSYLNETLYDVDCVERILGYFLEGITEDDRSITEADHNISTALMLVGKLIDGYLSEIASDANLKPEKFYDLAIALPDRARLLDDGLYRAIDVYFKAHPWISEAEREKICGVSEWQKLTLEACTHASQNERLPLRAVVQILFFEQLQLRHSIAASDADGGRGGDGGDDQDDDEARARENQLLRAEMASMRTRVHELERECTTMKKAIEKIDNGHVEERGWLAKLGCKFNTQVCDSHEPATPGGPRSKARTQHQQRRF